jgi:hypothetical protein
MCLVLVALPIAVKPGQTLIVYVGGQGGTGGFNGGGSGAYGGGGGGGGSSYVEKSATNVKETPGGAPRGNGKGVFSWYPLNVTIRRAGYVAELTRLPRANATIVHRKRLESIDLGVEVFIEPFRRRPVYGWFLACGAACLRI